jgi:hypothetical protein
MKKKRFAAEQIIGFPREADAGLAIMNRPGYELTPRSWTVAIAPISRYFSASISPD